MIFYLLGILSYYKLAKKPVPFGICLSFFLVISIPPITTLFFLLNKHWIFQAIAFVAGFFCWTFIEYCINRFWVYRKNNYNHPDLNHFFYHFTIRQTFILEIKNIAIITTTLFLIYFSCKGNSFLFLPVGIFSGFAVYSYRQGSAYRHKQRSGYSQQRKLPVQYQSNHAGKCYGLTVTWWDYLFGTMPEKLTWRKRSSRSGCKNYYSKNLKEKFNY